jgi:hypothetical protein
MATLKANRGLQYPLVAIFTFNMTDDMVNTSGVDTAFKANAGTVYDIIGLPPNATVTGGDITVSTASNDSGTATISVGDSGSATRYASAVSTKSAARTALTPTGYVGSGENIRITLANANGDATQGTVTVRVQYVVSGRVNEVQVS